MKSWNNEILFYMRSFVLPVCVCSVCCVYILAEHIPISISYLSCASIRRWWRRQRIFAYSLLLHWHALALKLSLSLPCCDYHHQRSVYNQPAMHEFDFCFYNGNRCISSLAQLINDAHPHPHTHTYAQLHTHTYQSKRANEKKILFVNEMITRNERTGREVYNNTLMKGKVVCSVRFWKNAREDKGHRRRKKNCIHVERLLQVATLQICIYRKRVFATGLLWPMWMV